MVANGFEGVPWMIGGGAEHSADIGRVLAYAATGGGDGVVSPGDCKVVASSVADNHVHMGVGGIVLRNRYGGVKSQTYVGRAVDVSDLTVGSTGSSGRSDLIIAKIMDPQFGDPAPGDIANGPYLYPDIVPGVPATTDDALDLGLSKPYYALARIDLPPNTTAVTNGMIKDLRQLVAPRQRREMFSNSGIAEAPNPLNSTTPVTWPALTFSVKVPRWATHADLRIQISGILQISALGDAALQAHIGNSQTSDNHYLDSDNFVNGLRHTITLTCGGPLLDAEKGKTITCKVTASRFASSPGIFQIDRGTSIGYDIEFSEKAV